MTASYVSHHKLPTPCTFLSWLQVYRKIIKYVTFMSIHNNLYANSLPYFLKKNDSKFTTLQECLSTLIFLHNNSKSWHSQAWLSTDKSLTVFLEANWLFLIHTVVYPRINYTHLVIKSFIWTFSWLQVVEQMKLHVLCPRWSLDWLIDYLIEYILSKFQWWRKTYSLP